MENFIVSARKYRPQTFDTVVGQQHITTTLKNAIKNHQLAHAFLFCGPRGVGKTTCARILAKTINCENPGPDGEACDQCTSCKTFNEGSSFNIHELDAASNNSVEDIRTLTEQVRFAPQAGKYKIYIIDEVHMLSASAFNAFLKTLEEPPPYAIFILATTEKHKILPTILSRCQIFDFRRITTQDTVQHLKEICTKEQISADEDALHVIAQKSEGCMRDALSILDKIVSFTNGQISYTNTLEHLNILDYDYFFRVMEAIMAQDAGQALLVLDEILQKGFEGDDFLEGFAAFLRNLLVCKDKKVTHLLEVSDNLKERYQKFANSIGAGLLISSLHLLNETGIQYKQAGNKRLHVEMALIKLCYLQQAVQLAGDPGNGAVSKKKVTDPAQVQQLRAPFARKITLPRKEQQPVTPILEEPEEPKLVIESAVPDKEEIPVKNPISPVTRPHPESSPAPKTSSGKIPNAASHKLSDLKTLRRKIMTGQENNGHQEAAIPLSTEALREAWTQYVLKAREEEKIQLAAHMEMAEVQMSGDERVEVICRNELQRRFIEEEKMEVAEHLKQAFHNPALILLFTVNEAETPAGDLPPILSAREQYQRMIEKYPLIRELKDKLNLELDY